MNRAILTHHLQEAINRQEKSLPSSSVLSTGCPAIDRLLPEKGLRTGMLVEWLALVPGSSAGLLGLLSCQEASKEGGMLVVVDRQQSFYSPVAAAWGDRRMIVVHPTNQADHLWALVQSLESPAVAAVWSALETLDSKTYQRVRLAAQTGNTLCVLLRPAQARGQPSWADVQFQVQPVGSLVEVSLTRCRGTKAGGKVLIEIDATHGTLHEKKTHSLHLASQLAHPKNQARRTGT